MKTIISLLLTLCVSLPLFVFSQAVPQKMNYQAVARTADGAVIADKEVGLRIAIVSSDDMERPVYAEEHQVTTNKLGLMNLQIGAGEALEGSMQSIDWGASAHYLKIYLDSENVGHFEEMGTSQLLTVPYAFYAEKSGSAGYNEEGNSRNDPDNWSKSGNASTVAGTDFVGTTDAQDLVFKTNDTEVGRFKQSGDLELPASGRITFNGENALSAKGTQNIMIGSSSGETVSSGYGNAFIGYQAGQYSTTGRFNAMIGYRAGRETTTGIQNAFIGYQAGEDNTTGGTNVAIGWNAATELTTGNNNVAIGGNAGRVVGTGSNNIFIGRNSGQNTTLSDNTFIGFRSGNDNTTGKRNTYIGNNAGGSATIENATAIGYNATATQSNSVVLGNNAKVGIGTSAPAYKPGQTHTFSIS